MIYHETEHGILYNGESLEVLRTMPDNSVNCCVTSPPYWGLRDYGCNGQLGLERTPEEYVARMVELFREVRRVLTKDGTLWLNLGDSYASNGCYLHTWMDKHPEKKHLHTKNSERYKDVPAFRGGEYSIKPKDLVGIPWRVAFALQADGWYLRQDIIWHKPNPMPESVTDRCTKSHEYVFLMSKSARYYYDNEAIKENSTTFENRPSGVERNRLYGYNSKENNNPQAYLKNIKGNISERGVTRTTEGLNLKTQQEKTSATRNRRSVWTVTTKPFKGAHFATFPRDLIRPMIQAGCPAGGVVLDPFMGSGTTAIEAISQGNQYIGIDLSPDYCEIAAKRIDTELDQTTIFSKRIEV